MEPLRILVAEDDALVAEDLRQTLEDIGHRVVAVVHEGNEVASEARAHAADLALLDIRLPGELDGIEVGRLLARDLAIPIVFVTAYADEETTARALQTDPMGYLVKPVDPRQLRTVIELAARRHGRERRIRESLEEMLEAHTVLRRSQGSYRALFRNSPAAIYVVAPDDGVIRDVNGRFTHLFGWARNDAIGKGTDALSLWPAAADRRDLVARLEREGTVEVLRVSCATAAGEPRELEVSVRRTEFEDAPCLLVLAHDVTERAAQESALEQLALYDSLTGLPNRNLFRDRLKQSLERARRERRQVAVLFVDLDRFKVVNDTLGHAAGDQVLALAGDRLQSCLRDEDTVARLGGDEFAVVVVEKGSSRGGAEAAARRIHVALEPPFDLGGVEVRVRASVGIAIAPSHASSVADLVRFSDAAMYTAKGTGGGGHRIFDATRDSGAPRHLVTRDDIVEALDRDELVLHFQPVSALDTGEIVGAEALVRWAHPERGLLAPAGFVPLAEESGLTQRLGHRVLELALGHVADWGSALPADFFVSVNVSPRHLAHPDIAVELSALLEAHDLAPGRLAIEITEGAILLSPERLHAVRRLGVRVALDDFGTGRSPLAYLSELDLDIVKLDRTMISRLGRRWADFVTARSVILCAEGLGLDVVAEGIETEEQVRLLVELGCPMGQGHLFARPMESGAFADLLRESRD